jgi:heme exporter protein D
MGLLALLYNILGQVLWRKTVLQRYVRYVQRVQTIAQ